MARPGLRGRTAFSINGGCPVWVEDVFVYSLAPSWCNFYQKMLLFGFSKHETVKCSYFVTNSSTVPSTEHYSIIFIYIVRTKYCSLCSFSWQLSVLALWLWSRIKNSSSPAPPPPSLSGAASVAFMFAGEMSGFSDTLLLVLVTGWLVGDITVLYSWKRIFAKFEVSQSRLRHPVVHTML